MNLPPSLTPMLRDRLERISAAATLNIKRDQCRVLMGLTESQMASTMFRLFGASTWPPVIDPLLWTLPIEEVAPPTNGGRRKVEKAKDEDEIAQRVAADQARIRNNRERWLDIEQQKYGLKRRGTSIDDMPA
jgi:hypothetical protein